MTNESSATVGGSEAGNVGSAVIRQYARHEKDTGSTEVQIALITQRLNHLQGHFSAHKKDNHSRRGLILMVGRRRRLLEYLKKTNITGYRALIESLGIRK
jgi:small subunit ribosomal protein S15